MNPLNANVPMPLLAGRAVIVPGQIMQASGPQPIMGFKDSSKRSREYEMWLVKVKPRRVSIFSESAFVSGLAEELVRAVLFRALAGQALANRTEVRWASGSADVKAHIAIDLKRHTGRQRQTD